MKAVFLDCEGLRDLNLTGLHEICDTLVIHDATKPELVVERAQGAEVLILNKVRIGRQELQALPGLRLICVVATGTDVIDLGAAAEVKVVVCNCQAYGIDSVVQHVFSSLLALQTNLISYHNAVRAGRWQLASQFCFLDYPIIELRDKVLGIVGYGNLGKGVANVARAFGMEVMVAARPGATGDDRPALKTLLAEVDVLTLHCPLTDATRGLIDADALKKMKPTAFLLNVARGGIVEEEALAEALRNKEIAGAAVDVLSEEPPVSGNPLLAEDIPNLILTPHVAWASVEARQRIIDQTIANIDGYLRGQLMRAVSV